MSVNFIFTLINFSTVIALGFYLYRKYGRNMLFEHMAAQENATRLLQLEEVALKEEQLRLKNLIEEEHLIARQLLEKVNRWRCVQDQEEVRLRAIEQEIQKDLKKKAHQQSQWYAQHQLANRLLPQVMAKTRAQLDVQFKVPGKHTAYTQEILTFMKKSL